jgi:hypothetical protein
LVAQIDGGGSPTLSRLLVRSGVSSAFAFEFAADVRVTTGAIYHHFGNKQRLFRTVAEQIEAELLACA